MKYKAREYARALVELKEFNVDVFLKLLQKNGDRRKLKDIIAWIEKIKYRKIMIETARPLKNPTSLKLRGTGDIIHQKINPELIAGVKITVNGERQLDFSLKNKLEKILQ